MSTIDASEIADITIDGTQVKEVTVDGSVVWTAEQQIGETGTTSLSTTIDGGAVNTISFSKTYNDPAVFAYIVTRGGGQSIECRVRNLTTTDCEIFNEEPDDAGHNTETVVYMVMETGDWVFPDGTQVEVGKHSTSTTFNSGDSKTGDSISLSGSYGSTPAILHTLNTYNNSQFMSTNARNVSTTDFELQQMAAQTGNTGTTETIAWMAIDQGTGTNNGYAYEVGRGNDGANDGPDDNPHSISFSQSFGSTPDIVTKGQTLNGGDGFWARSSGTQWNTSGHEVYAEEDQVGDTERGHTDEYFGYLAIEPNAVIMGQ